jgi:hypothetical protein
MKKASDEKTCARDINETGWEIRYSFVMYGLSVPVNKATAMNTVINVPSERNVNEALLVIPRATKLLFESIAADIFKKPAREKRIAPPRKSAEAVKSIGTGITTGIIRAIREYVPKAIYGRYRNKIPEPSGNMVVLLSNLKMS